MKNAALGQVSETSSRKTTEYILGLITGLAIMFGVWACTSPLTAYSEAPGSTEWNPMYVKIVD